MSHFQAVLNHSAVGDKGCGEGSCNSLGGGSGKGGSGVSGGSGESGGSGDSGGSGGGGDSRKRERKGSVTGPLWT